MFKYIPCDCAVDKPCKLLMPNNVYAKKINFNETPIFNGK